MRLLHRHEQLRLSEHQGYEMLSPCQANAAALEIVFPTAGKLRSKSVVSRSRARSTGKYPSWKMGRMVQWESPHELNAFRLLDADPAVSAYHEQPFTIRFVFDGKTRIRHPDLLVEWRHRREIWEIEQQIGPEGSSSIDETRLLECALPQLGFAYRLVKAEDLAREPRLSRQ
jgi:hypothetical protein